MISQYFTRRILPLLLFTKQRPSDKNGGRNGYVVHDGSPDPMIFDLNILKIAGAFVAGLAGIIGILGHTRTQDNKLTRSGKWLFGMAIVGLVLAMGTQSWEWRKRIEDDRAAQRRNGELLDRLDKETHQISRAVTRFQDEDISFDWSFSFDSNDQVFGPYIRDLAKLVEDASFEPPFTVSDWFAAARDRGLRVSGWHPKFGVHFLSIEADSPAMPDKAKYPRLRDYIFEAAPEITLFKTPIKPDEFFTRWPKITKILDAPWNPQVEAPRPDLILKLKPGNVRISFVLQKTAPKVSSIRVEDKGMAVINSDSWGDIVSVDDLDGCQGIIDLVAQTKDFTGPWKTANNPRLGCRVNNQPLILSRPFPTQTGYGGKRDQLIYSFTLSTAKSAKVKD